MLARDVQIVCISQNEATNRDWYHLSHPGRLPPLQMFSPSNTDGKALNVNPKRVMYDL